MQYEVVYVDLCGIQNTRILFFGFHFRLLNLQVQREQAGLLYYFCSS